MNILRRTCFILALTVIVSVSFAQDSLWSRTYGGPGRETCNTLLATTDGGYALAGMTDSYRGFLADFWLVKVDVNGDSLWCRAYGGEGSEDCSAMAAAPDGGYLLAGYTNSFGSGNADFWLVKTNANGDSLWSRTYGGFYFDFCYDLTVTPDGGCILAGRTSTFGAGNADFWIVKTNQNGDSLWNRTYGSPYGDECRAVRPTSDGGFVLAGFVAAAAAGNTDFWLIKIDANGDSLWSRTYGGQYYDICTTVEVTADGGFILAGYTHSYGPGTPAEPNFWMLKTDANGDSLWSRTYGGNGADVSYAIIQSPDGGYLLSGVSYSFGTGCSDAWLIKTDANGDSIWSRLYGGSLEDECLDILQTADGGCLLAGFTDSFESGSGDMWLLKVGPGQHAENSVLLPVNCTLHPIYPNPFNATALISYDLPVTSRIVLTLFTLDGRVMQTIANEIQSAGQHRLVYDASHLSSGTYFCRLAAAQQSAVQKMVVVR